MLEQDLASWKTVLGEITAERNAAIAVFRRKVVGGGIGLAVAALTCGAAAIYFSQR